ncbi:MAG: hypothetical protein K9J75_02840 [Cyanobium usitatum Tobar12.5m-G36]|nr:hypothetical protein [Cyanobium usitatum Tobar12.5m-G36]
MDQSGFFGDTSYTGPAPFYAGFGSMITSDPEALAAAVVPAPPPPL